MMLRPDGADRQVDRQLCIRGDMAICGGARRNLGDVFDLTLI
jgi:hypothetical protein